MPTEHHKALLENYRIFEAREMRLEGGNLYPDVANVLSELKKAQRLYIVSNCLKGYEEACRIIKIPFVYASYGFGVVEHPKYEITDFADLLKIIEWV